MSTHINSMIEPSTGEVIAVHTTLRTEFNYHRDEASIESGLSCPEEEGQTQQQFKDECDINTIVQRFGLTGELPDNPRPPVSGDFTGVTDFHTAMQAVRKAEEGFMEMPAHIRARFHNDPQEMMTFLENTENREEALKLGIIAKPPEKTRDVLQAIDEMSAKLPAAITPKTEK